MALSSWCDRKVRRTPVYRTFKEERSKTHHEDRAPVTTRRATGQVFAIVTWLTFVFWTALYPHHLLSS